MIILVCGGRDYSDKQRVFEVLDKINEAIDQDDEENFLTIVHGACPTGADKFAEDWCKLREIDYKGYPAKWKKQGKKAGPIRNARMIAENDIDLVVSFPGGTGTANMIRLTKENHIRLLEVES